MNEQGLFTNIKLRDCQALCNRDNTKTSDRRIYCIEEYISKNKNKTI